jgi:hypothetical protein
MGIVKFSKLLVVLASRVILGSESLGIHQHRTEDDVQ